MKLIIAGSRDLSEEMIYAELVQLRISDHAMVQADEIVSGCARGADTAGEMYADFYGIPVKKFPADWDTHGKAAGPIRNKQMAQYADAALIFMKRGGTPGSKNMKDHMHRMKKKVWVYEVE
jgi:hypothetical protein